MKEYAFETVACNEGGGWVVGKTIKHREIITTYAEKGYRYIGFIPTEATSYGRYLRIDLIFEKDV